MPANSVRSTVSALRATESRLFGPEYNAEKPGCHWETSVNWPWSADDSGTGISVTTFCGTGLAGPGRGVAIATWSFCSSARAPREKHMQIANTNAARAGAFRLACRFPQRALDQYEYILLD